MYLSKMHIFQKYNSTCAYKIAGGVDPTASSSSKPTKQRAIGLGLASKISKAFLDALYAFLDGLVHLASDEWSVDGHGMDAIGDPGASAGANVSVGAPTLDLSSTVSLSSLLIRVGCWYLYQHTRLLLVLSNLDHLKRSMIPSMFTQMQNAFGASIDEEHQVSKSMSIIAVFLTIFRP